jgi:hypothetical protein
MKTVKKYNVIIPFRHGEHEFLKTKEFSSDMVTFTEDDYKFLISRGNIVEVENQKEEKKLENLEPVKMEEVVIENNEEVKEEVSEENLVNNESTEEKKTNRRRK